MQSEIKTAGSRDVLGVHAADLDCAIGFDRLDPTLPLLREAAYIDGQWVDGDGVARMEVINPANGLPVGSVPALGASKARQAVAAAKRAFAHWRNCTAWERAAIIRRWSQLMDQHAEELAVIMTLEQGKPLEEARGEIQYARSFLDWFAAEGLRSNGEILPTHLADRHLSVERVPVGISAALTPWNFPSAMITRKAGAALAAGCPVIVRPAEHTPFSALALAALGEEAGLPPGVFSVVTGEPEAIVQSLMDAPDVRHVSFTGSTAIGRKVMRQAAGTVKRVTLELGGHAPFIVLEDADVEVAAQAAVAAKFQTTGQDCLAANRILVHRALYEPFLEAFVGRVRQLQVGNGLSAGVDQGPLMHQAAVDKCSAHVEDAIDRGARLLVGGCQSPQGRLFFTPSVLADVTPEMLLFREETFGPVAGVQAFDADADAVRLANDSEYGLAAYLYGRSVNRLERLSRQLDYGMVAINTVKMTGPPVPFGGIKQSGLGREGGRQGLEEFQELKYTCRAIPAGSLD